MAHTLNIKTVRKTLKLSQAGLGAKIGVDQSTICAWEKGGLPKRGLTREAIEQRVAALLEEHKAKRQSEAA
jgi:DNA-binding XRE family transcriptional regulator